MPDQDVLGPGAAGAPRALPSSDPSITATIQFPDASDTWFGDCVNNTAGTGTPYVAEWANRQLQQIRRVVRNSGVPLTYADDQFAYAVQQGLQWVGTFGGTANAITATMVPAPMLLVPGTEIKGLIGATNTGAATLNVNGLGTFPVTNSDSTALTGAEMVIGGVASFIYTGSSFLLMVQSLLGFQRILKVNTTYFVNNSTGSDSTGNGLTSGTAWATLPHALSVISTYNLGGNTVTIQLGLTGIAYAGPGSFNAPSNGVLIIRGDPAAQASYTISATPATQTGVIMPQAGTVSLIGVTVVNVSGGASTATIWARTTMTLQNVTISATGGTGGALLQAGIGGFVSQNAGVSFNGSATSAIFVANSGALFQFANGAVTGSPTFSVGFIQASTGGVFEVAASSLSWSGSATGKHYEADTGGLIVTNAAGPTFFPGSTSGTTATGGQYI